MKKSELNQFIKEEVLKAMAEAVDTGAFRRLVITSPKHKLIQSGAEKYLTQNAHMYPDLTFKVMPSPKPNTFVIDLVGNKATVVGIKLQDLAERLDNTAIVLVRKEKKLGVKESIITEDSSMAFLILAQAAIVNGLLIGQMASGGGGSFHPIDDLKAWWKKRKSDKALKSIIDKIKGDEDVVKFMKLTPSQQRGKFRSLIATKLNDEELEYLSKINKSHFQMNEGSMSDINLMAQEAKDFNSFVKEFMKEYSIDSGSTTKLKDWLQSIYDDAKSQNESLNEAQYQQELKDIHFETDTKKQEELKATYGKYLGELSRSRQIDAADYMLKKFRKEIKYDDKGTEVGVFLPGSYAAAISTLGDGPHAKKFIAKSWNQKEYKNWIASVASNGGSEHAYDMAQNAKHEQGLINWVKKNNPGENPLEVIQWDIESLAESKTTITEGATKTILGVKFKMAPAPGNGIKFEFVDAKQFIKSGVSANEMVEEIQKMLDDKFGKDLFWFKPAGRMQYDTKVNGFEFRMNANQFFKDL